MTLSWVKNKRKLGGLLPCTCGGLFGRKGTERLLMMLSNLTKRLNLLSNTFVNWARVYTEDHMLSMSDFVDWLSS